MPEEFDDGLLVDDSEDAPVGDPEIYPDMDTVTETQPDRNPAQEVWFMTTSRTAFERRVLKGETHIEVEPIREYLRRIADGWRIHTFQSIRNDMDIFVVLTRG